MCGHTFIYSLGVVGDGGAEYVGALGHRMQSSHPERPVTL